MAFAPGFTRTSDVAPPRLDAPSPTSRLLAAAAQVGPEAVAATILYHRAGLSVVDAFQLACCGATPAEAQAGLRALASRAPNLRDYGPTMIVGHVLSEIAGQGGPVGREKVAAMLRHHGRTHVLRPDGWLVHGLSGEARVRAGDLALVDGSLRAGPFELGGAYVLDGGQLSPMTEDASADRSRPSLLELPLETPLAARALDGAENALFGVAEAVAHTLMDPVQTVHDLGRLPNHVAALLAHSPELFDRFAALPLGEQVEAVGELSFGLALGGLGASAAARGAGALPKLASIEPGFGAAFGGAAVGVGRLSWSLEASLAVATGASGAAGTGAFLAKALDPNRFGPQSCLPVVDAKAEASLKRAAKKLDREEAQALQKALPRVDQARRALIQDLDELLASGDWSRRTRAALTKARNALKDHGSQADLTGALRDRLGIPVRSSGTGRTFDHLEEVEAAVSSLEHARTSLVFEIRAVGMRGQVHPGLQRTLELLDALRDQIVAFSGP